MFVGKIQRWRLQAIAALRAKSPDKKCQRVQERRVAVVLPLIAQFEAATLLDGASARGFLVRPVHRFHFLLRCAV
jgi:hypothetical protein